MKTLMLCAALFGAAVTARALEVVHQPVTCVPAGRFARIVAQGAPADAVVSAEAQFRTGPDAGWYRVRLDAEGVSWHGFLPQPTTALRSFEYRVVLFGSDATARETAPTIVTVAASSDGCPAGGTSAAAATMVLQVPPGAPLVPPVPAGFSPVGATLPQAAQRQAPVRDQGGPGGKLAIGAGVLGAAGGAVAVVAGSGGGREPLPVPPEPPRTLPSFTYTGTIPGAGATVSRGRDTFGVIVTMDREPNEPMPVQFTVGLQRDTAVGATSRCANMTGTFQGVQRPLGLVLTGPVVLVPGAPCGESFDVRGLFLQVLMSDRAVMQGTVPLPTPLRFEP
jgi:hypothetical protein